MVLDIQYKNPPPNISHWSLSANDNTIGCVLFILFCLAGKKNLHSVYNEDVKIICDGRKINDTGKKRVSEIQNVFAKNYLSNDGKDRKAFTQMCFRCLSK